MIAIIGGETRTFRPLIDLNRAGRRGGHLPGHLKVGIHSDMSETTQGAADHFFPGCAHNMTEIGKERGWRELTRRDFLPKEVRKVH